MTQLQVVACTGAKKSDPLNFLREVEEYLKDKGFGPIPSPTELYKESSRSDELKQLQLISDGQEHPDGFSVLVVPHWDDYRNMIVCEALLLHNFQIVHFAKEILARLDVPKKT